MSELKEHGGVHFQDPSGSAKDRQEERVGVDINVTVNSDSNFYAGHAQNLSEGGIFIATHIVHAIGTLFDLSLHIDDGRGSVVRGTGEVRWIRAADETTGLPAGLGIRFLELKDDGAERITAFLQQRRPIEYESDPGDAYPDEEGFEDAPTVMTGAELDTHDTASAPRLAPRDAVYADDAGFDEPTTAIHVGDPSGAIEVDHGSVDVTGDDEPRHG